MTAKKKLNDRFFQRSAIVVAPGLLGRVLRLKTGNKILSGIIVETEAYVESDPASHSFGGIKNRNRPMFLQGGHTYVYFIYGNHFCFNIVTGKKHSGEAVLIRAIEPIHGLDTMRKNRSRKNILDLCSGPGKLCQAFGINRKHNLIYLPTHAFLSILAGKKARQKDIEISKRIGIQKGQDLLWRFSIRDSRFVSR